MKVMSLRTSIKKIAQKTLDHINDINEKRRLDDLLEDWSQRLALGPFADPNYKSDDITYKKFSRRMLLASPFWLTTTCGSIILRSQREKRKKNKSK